MVFPSALPREHGENQCEPGHSRIVDLENYASSLRCMHASLQGAEPAKQVAREPESAKHLRGRCQPTGPAPAGKACCAHKPGQIAAL